MKITNVREAACMQASYLINQISSKKGFKQVGNEISKMSEIFGIEFDKHIYKSLLEDIDFKDQRSLLSNRNNSNKNQFLIQEFPSLMARPDFINIFSSIVEFINTSASANEIFDGLVKLLKPNYENQFKIIISFFYAQNPKFSDDIRNLFTNKCYEVHKDSKSDQLTKNTIQILALLINSIEDFRNDNFLKTTFMGFLLNKQMKTSEVKNFADVREHNEFVEEFNAIVETDEESIEFEKLLIDLGPWMINNSINLNKTELINSKLDERRLANLIICICKQPQCVEDKESRNLNKIFLQTLNNDLSMTIDENNEKKMNISWNLENYYKMMRNSLDNLDYNLVFSYLDDPNFYIKDKKSFDNFVLIMKNLKISQYQNILMNTLFRRWSNELNQIETLNFLINNPQTEAFSFKYSLRKVKRNFELALNKNTMTHLVENWSSIDLIDALIKLSRGNYYLKIKDIFEWPIANIPEVLVIGLSLIRVESEDFIFEELINEALPPFLGNHINSIAVLEEVWTYNKELVIKTICNLYKSNPDLMNLSRILDITQKLKDSLIPISSCNDHNFTVNLAILAVKRDFLHIDQWLNDRITKVGDDFIESLLGYIKENVIKQCKDITTQLAKENILEKCQLTLESLAIIFENLSAPKIKTNPKVSKRIQNEINVIYKEIFELFDELQTQPQNSEEIEESANKLFHNLFHGEASVDQTIQIISSYKNSQNQMESEIYACMIHSLLDEYRFFHKYPEKELKTMATLFGQILNNSLLDDMIENIAVKYIIEGIKKSSGKMFLFSTVALEQIVDKLNSFSRYVPSITQVMPHIKSSNLQLYERAIEKLNEINNKNKVYQQVSMSHNHEDQSPIHTNNIVNKQNSIPSFNQPNNNFINFDNNNYDEKIKLSNVKHMPGLNQEEFAKNYQKLNNIPLNNIPLNQMNYNIPTNNQFNLQYMQPQQGNLGNNKNIPNQTLKDNMGNFIGMNANPNMGFGYGNEMFGGSPYYYPPNQNLNIPNTNSKKISVDNIQNKEESKDLKNIGEFDNYGYSDYKNSQRFKDSNDDKFISNKAEDRNKLNNKDFEEINTQSSFNPDKTNNMKKNILRINPNNKQNIDISHYIENEHTVQAPPQDVIDKINFIFNSMSKVNIAEKSNDLKNILNSDILLKWFSNYFIINRISGENNNHNNYGELISNIDSKELNQLLIKDTILIIKKLIISEKLLKDNTEKNILKHLGSWLGIMTLARNKPILSKDLELKELIYDAYQNGKLTAIIPFICRILEHSFKTKVFHPKNPWIQAIMAILIELFHKNQLKINIRFEIENIFKKLEIDMNQVNQTRILENYVVNQNSPDFTKDSTLLEAKYQDLFSLINTNIIDQYTADLQLIIKENNPNSVISNSEIISLVTNALVNAINDIIAPVIERAVNISLVTTIQLVCKDFSFDSDGNKFGTASNLCIKTLAGSLAMVTCKEPLRMSFINHFKELLNKKLSEEFSIEYINNINNSEILDIGCNFIQNNVIKRAIDKIEKDKIILEEIEKRKKQKLWEPKQELLNKINSLPEVLKPNLNGLNPDQYKIYEDFEKVYDSNRKEVLKKHNLIKMIIPLLKEFMVFTMQNVSKANDRYKICLKNLGCIALEHSDIEYIDDDDNITNLSKMMLDSKISEVVASDLIQTNLKYVISSVKTRNLTLVNLYSETLKGWILLHPKLAAEVTNKILKSEDLSIRFLYDIHSFFLRKNIFDKAEYERICLSYLEDSISAVYIRTLFKKLFEKNLLQMKDLQLIPSYMVDKNSNTYYEFFFNKSISNINVPNLELTDWKIVNIKDYENYIGFSKMSIYTFSQIMNLYYKNLDSESLRQFLKTFNDSSISKNEDQMNALISIITEHSVKECLFYPEGNHVSADRLQYNKIDSLAKFVLLLLNYITNINKLKFFENILFGIFKILHLDYNKNPTSFNQKPYYRLFINIIYLLYHAEGQPHTEYLFTSNKKIHYFCVLADFFRTLRPQNYPGFAVAWLDIISYKYFNSLLLENEGYKNKQEYMYIQRFEKYLNLVTDIMSFLKMYSNESVKSISVQQFIKYVYKFMFLLTKSYPEFVSCFYFILIHSLPVEGFVQMKNLILCATPNDIETLDPFAEDFKIEQHPNIQKNAVILFDLAAIVSENDIKVLVDDYIEFKNEMNIDEIIKKLNKRDYTSNYQIINWLVLYLSHFSINKKIISNKEIIDIFIKMLKNLDVENRDFFINGILNELRYPSAQTHYFNSILLWIYNDIKVDAIEEHIYRNLIERLLYKPYTWGIIITYLELSRNNKYIPIVKKTYDNAFGIDKIFDEILKFVNASKFNKTLDNFVC